MRLFILFQLFLFLSISRMAIAGFKPWAENSPAEKQFLNHLNQKYKDADYWLKNRKQIEDINRLRRAADQGYALAQNNLGVMYQYGRGGLRQSYEEAVKWFQKAADQGHDKAQNNLGVMYEHGRGGLQQSDEEAVKWYQKAADQGCDAAQKILEDLRSQKAAEILLDLCKKSKRKASFKTYSSKKRK